ncbi:MAG: ABC transporter ATP-binding protein [Planctomycetaceae bacterium]|nr:ABC transporter ATP-binding protein [Planctomycetaceae bacterium]
MNILFRNRVLDLVQSYVLRENARVYCLSTSPLQPAWFAFSSHHNRVAGSAWHPIVSGMDGDASAGAAPATDGACSFAGVHFTTRAPKIKFGRRRNSLEVCDSKHPPLIWLIRFRPNLAGHLPRSIDCFTNSHDPVPILPAQECSESMINPLMVYAFEVRKSYGDRVAVDGLTLTVPQGQTLGLLGPNGAGKTTTLHLLIGLLKPDSGRVSISGSEQVDTREIRSLIGIAPQSLSLYEELTAEENLNFFGRLYGLRGERLRARVEWALDFANLQDRRRHRVQTYSGGMKRRLNFACALVHEPKLVLLDEPTVGVDPQSRNHIFEGIRQLQKSGLTIIYTTHYMEEAQKLCDQVAIIDHGKLLELGTVRELIQRHGGVSVVTGECTTAPPSTWPGRWDGLVWRMETESPLETLQQYSIQTSHFTRLQIDQPDLESVFLRLTGRSLRD